MCPLRYEDIWNFDGKMLVVLDDSDVEQMLLAKRSGQDPCRLILEKIQEFRLKIKPPLPCPAKKVLYGFSYRTFFIGDFCLPDVSSSRRQFV